jgi:O-antigen/teichoic acid export membrane protein
MLKQYLSKLDRFLGLSMSLAAGGALVKALAMASNLAWNAILLSTLGFAQYGIFSVPYTIVAIAHSPIAVALPDYIAYTTARASFVTMKRFRIVAAAFAFVLCAFFLGLSLVGLRDEQADRASVELAGAMLVMLLSNYAITGSGAFIKAAGRPFLGLFLEIAARHLVILISIAGTLTLTRTTISSAATGLMMVSGALVATALMAVALACLHNKCRTDERSFKHSPKKMSAYGLTGLLTVSLTQADVLLISAFASSEIVGSYRLVQQLMQVVNFAQGAIGAIFAPTLSRLHFKGDVAALCRTFEGARRLSIFGAVIGFLLIALTMSSLLSVVSGSVPDGAWQMIAVLGAGYFVSACAGPIGVFANSTGYIHHSIRSLILSAGTYAAVAFLLLPAVGYWAFPWASASGLIARNLYLTALTYLPFRRRLYA